MSELLYLLRVGSAPAVQQGIRARLGLDATPGYVRVATLAPLSNHGIPAGWEASVLSLDTEGLLVGVEGLATPRLFVPWSNLAYLADGDALQAQVAKG